MNLKLDIDLEDLKQTAKRVSDYTFGMDLTWIGRAVSHSMGLADCSR